MSASQIESAAKWLGKLVVEQVQYLAEVHDKVEELQSELEWMQCFLWDVDDKQNKNAIIRKWVSEIKELALRSEDVIETYILEVSHKREKSSNIIAHLMWYLCIWRDAKTLYSLGSEMNSLSAKLSKLSSRLQIYGIKSSYDNNSTILHSKQLSDIRRTYSHTEEDDVMGLDERVRDVADKLVVGKQKVLLIHGMGGIGKTTFARKVYHHPPLKDHFVGFAWAYVSQNLQLGSICREILLQLIPEKEEGERKIVKELEDSQLPGKLFDVLKKIKCLVILDDVWFSRDWNRFLPAFPLNDDTCGSKLLVTTRNPEIASDNGDGVIFKYEAEVLDAAMSWKLFEKKAHYNKDNNADSLKLELASKMLLHCNGHPLAIVLLGGILATKKTNEEWQSVYDNLPSHLRGHEMYNGVYEVLAMSYYELPYNLKPCFLHLSCFPEDFEIPTEKLYHLWIAEGVVSSAQDQVVSKRSLEDIAKDYLHELVQKGMVQVGSYDSDQQINTCRLHDLMRDKCLEMAKEENFLQIVDHEARIVNEGLRRVAIYVGGHDHDIHKSLPNSLSGEVPSLRSLLLFRTGEVKEESCERMITRVSKDFQLLRILDCSGLPLTGGVPNKIGTLNYLRYLSLKGTHVTKLECSIENLKCLLILDLRVSNVIIKLPNVLWKMKSLRQLYFPSRILSQETNLHQGYEVENGEVLTLDNLGYLEKLEDVDFDTTDVKGLVGLTSMRKVSGSCVSKKESLDPFLKSSSIKNLSLKINGHMLAEDPMMLSGCDFLKFLHIDSARGFRLPIISLEMFPQNLVELGFWYCKLPKDPMLILGKLPRLKNLQLHICYDGSTLHCPPGGFPELTYLAIDGLFVLNKWIVEKDGFPKLTNVEIYNSPIRSLPHLLSPQVSIACNPCIEGIQKHGSCPFFKRRQSHLL